MTNAMPDIPRICTAIAEWSACLVFITILKPRFDIKKTVLIALSFLLGMSVFMVATAHVWIWLWIPCMAIAFLMMSALIYTCTKVNYRECLYYTMFAFCLAELVASVEWQTMYFFFPRALEAPIWSHALCMVLVYGLWEITVWKLINIYFPKDRSLEIGKKDLFTSFFIGIIIFAYSNMRFITMGYSGSAEYLREIAHTRSLVDVIGVAMLYAHLMLCCENKVRKELEAVQNVLQNQYQQYKVSRESIELINYKYHDLKHQIEVIRSGIDTEAGSALLDRMEAEIKQYELQNKTGNNVLDTVLTTKSMYCDKHHITLTIVADGHLIDFMDVMDICSVFGNALDNAIESVMKIADKEKRLIHLSVSQQKEFVMIRVENYYEETLQYEEGHLITTKKNKDMHGYGIKSIQYIVNKYDGAMDINVEDQWFSLKILIPLK